MSVPLPASPGDAVASPATASTAMPGARAVAVLSDGSADHTADHTADDRADRTTLGERRATLGLVLRRYAALIRDVAGVPTHAVTLEASSPARFAAVFSAAVRGVGDEVAAVFLPHTDPARARLVRSCASGPLVVTERDTTAIALTAALCTTLAGAGRTPGASRVVIAGAERMPMLAALLVAAGVGDLTAWQAADAAAFPLRRVADRADVVINLLGEFPAISVLRTEYPDLMVIGPDPRRDPLLALPGLLRAAVLMPGIELDVEVAQAAALALVMATPPLSTLPPEPDRALSDQVADAVIWALPPTARHPSGREPHNLRPDQPRPDTR